MRDRITRNCLCWSFAVGCAIFLVGCNTGGGTTSGTSGGPGYLTVPMAGWWHGSWSRNTTLTDIIVDTADPTTQLDPLDGVARLQITSASGSSQTISGSLLMTGFECFTSGTVSGSWSGSNIGMTVTDASTPAGSATALSLSGHQTSAGELKFAYIVASGECGAKRGSITLSKSG